MSRLGKTPINLPGKVEVSVKETTLTVKGGKGTIELVLPQALEATVESDRVILKFHQRKAVNKSFYGLYHSLIRNAITGVSSGFEKKLTLIGVGYRATVTKDTLDLQLGFSHPASVSIPQGLTVSVEKSTQITVAGIDKQLVGQFAADVRSLRPPEPYKGKGVRYVDEYVRKKAGKAAKGK